MTRKDFITKVLIKKVKPILYVIILSYAIFFLIQALSNKNSNERFFLFFITFSIGLFLLLGLIHLLINYLKSHLSKKAKSFFNKVSILTETISAILLIGLAINSWKENKIIEFIVIIGLLFFIMYTKKNKKLQ